MDGKQGWLRHRHHDQLGIGGTMSHDGNTRLLESLYEQFLDEGYSESEAAEKAKQAFEEMD